jgi:hypothetical protein
VHHHSAETQGPFDSAPLPLRLGMTVWWKLMPRERRYYVYIMQSSSRRALYIGMTNNLHRPVFQHKTQEFEGFSDDYDTVPWSIGKVRMTYTKPSRERSS